eukprot:2071122-Amphidinium_carterae.1
MTIPHWAQNSLPYGWKCDFQYKWPCYSLHKHEYLAGKQPVDVVLNGATEKQPFLDPSVKYGERGVTANY